MPGIYQAYSRHIPKIGVPDAESAPLAERRGVRVRRTPRSAPRAPAPPRPPPPPFAAPERSDAGTGGPPLWAPTAAVRLGRRRPAGPSPSRWPSEDQACGRGEGPGGGRRGAPRVLPPGVASGSAGRALPGPLLGSDGPCAGLAAAGGGRAAQESARAAPRRAGPRPAWLRLVATRMAGPRVARIGAGPGGSTRSRPGGRPGRTPPARAALGRGGARSPGRPGGAERRRPETPAGPGRAGRRADDAR
jgi:hypothetical protein